MRAGALDGLSIGFRTIKDHFDRAKGIRYLEEVDVPEISDRDVSAQSARNGRNSERP